MQGDKRWGELGDDSANFTSPYLLSFDDVEKLSKCFVATSPTKNVKPETTIVTQMYQFIFLFFLKCVMVKMCL